MGGMAGNVKDDPFNRLYQEQQTTNVRLSQLVSLFQRFLSLQQFTGKAEAFAVSQSQPYAFEWDAQSVYVDATNCDGDVSVYATSIPGGTPILIVPAGDARSLMFGQVARQFFVQYAGSASKPAYVSFSNRQQIVSGVGIK